MSRWLILREGIRSRWGGDLRRRYIFDGLLGRTGGEAVEFRSRLRQPLLDLRGPRWAIWRRARVVSSELLLDNQLATIRALGRATAIDVHDDPVLQAEALGSPLEALRAAELRSILGANTEAFRWLVAPSRPFAELAELDLDRVIVAANGTDTGVILAEPWPEVPAVGFISGAAPNRGIEALIEAVRLVRSEHPELRLLLWLAATGESSAAYLEHLRMATIAEPWIEIGTAPYDAMSAQLGRATVMAIPTPGHAYWDSVAPIKLYDALAAGRPTVTTPRAETARVVEAHDAGLVAAGDSPDDLATPIARLIGDAATARRMGANARMAAEREHDWRIIGNALADAILSRERRRWTW